ncbi:pseudaminic acid biosynthesis-associated methylase [Sinorhizobium fredii]|uniref:pseudaminic acid biosynthesis-associated methylase n=1 Tax=Rhizobium fredii TaxID=380 RepID=UPI001FCCBD28|nr:pseudaminic acid biosynthesis-associated methylase [Sinorhizobium fredii]WOS64771.1 pseudaminic acid biosynthesis-associated methylase [Sinorhizobium fredii GR64]WOS67210.1 pseudaminic acid biosynthesis-associated methylase [Sinorhizobium fredii GR64]
MATEQEKFWEGDFGSNYLERNQGDALVASKLALWAKILAKAPSVSSVRELGANIGLNLQAISSLIPQVSLQAVEINPDAFATLSQLPNVSAVCGSLYEPFPGAQTDLCFTCGVLIHLNPDLLPVAYQRLYEGSNRYVLVVEYYNPTPIEVVYRGHEGKLFKRDFAGEIMASFPDLQLVDYGFMYRGDPVFRADDLTWFLMEKRAL